MTTSGTALHRVAAHLLHSGAIACLEQHRGSGLLATAGDDGAIRLWQLSDLVKTQPPTPRGCLVGHGSAVSDVAFSDCGAFLASCSLADGTIRLWSVADREHLATLWLPASSVAFVPEDAAALLVAGPSLAPQLLDLRRVPACQHYCSSWQVAAGQHDVNGAGGSKRTSGAASATLHPAAAMWLLGSPRPSPADLPVQTPSQHPPMVVAASADSGHGDRRSGRPEGLGSPRQTGLLVEFSRKRPRRLYQPHPQGGKQGALRAAAPADAPCSSTRGMSPNSWLPGRGLPLHERAAMAMPLASPLVSPTLPASKYNLAPPDRAVLALWSASPAKANGVWDVRQRCFTYRQVGAGAGPAAACAALVHVHGTRDALRNHGCCCIGHCHWPLGYDLVVAFLVDPPSMLHACKGTVLNDAAVAVGCYEHKALSHSLCCLACLQGGHAHAARWLLPLPGGLHILTVAADGEGKLWSASSGGDGAVCGTLLPPMADRQESALGGCRPALSCCGRYAVCGGPAGGLAAWDLTELQRQAHLPLIGALRDGNATVAAAAAHPEAVTAVVVGAGDTLLASGDASGRLVVRWM